MRRITYKEYAGLLIKGDVEIGLPGPRHMDAASWLTAQVESGGKFGTVISYDGTGITAGIHQAIAVYPRELESPEDGYAKDDQGPLWELLHRCFQAYPDLLFVKDMKAFLSDFGIAISEGLARDAESHNILTGRYLRQVLTGSSDGYMPEFGPGRERAEFAAGMFSVFFSAMQTHALQLGWGEEYLLRRAKKLKMRHIKSLPSRGKTIQELAYERFYGVDAGLVMRKDIPAYFDLAMCIWLSYTVNAPAIALKRICRAFDYANVNKTDFDFSKELVRLLGTSKWGRWGADETNGRYQRTRMYAMKIWDESLFFGEDAIMPKDL